MHVPERPGPAPLANPRSDRVKAVRRLSGRSARVREGRFAVEGPQAVREAVAGPGVIALYVTDDAADRHAAILDAARARGVDPVPVTRRSVRVLDFADDARRRMSVRSHGRGALLRKETGSRAAILWEMGVEGDEADIRAYEMETGRAMRGVARAEPRDAATDAPSKASGD